MELNFGVTSVDPPAACDPLHSSETSIYLEGPSVTSSSFGTRRIKKHQFAEDYQAMQYVNAYI